MISTEFAAGAGFLLEKWLSRYNVSEDQKIPENLQNILLLQMTKGAKKGDQEEAQVAQVAHTPPGAGPALAVPG